MDNKLESVLSSIFTDSPYSNFRWPEHMWAVAEALNRVILSTNPLIDWRVRKARKEHRCSNRVCLIKPREQYYLSPNGRKICCRCERRLWRGSECWLYWRIRKANKDHECARGGCTIKNGDYYFIQSGDWSTDGIQLCGRCMALELYFENVGKLKAYRYLDWDYQHCEPKEVEKMVLYAGLHDSYFFPEKIKGIMVKNQVVSSLKSDLKLMRSS